jgi:hypothetical protein
MSELAVKTYTDQMRAAVREAARPHEIAIMDSSGDTKLIWDAENEDETLAARETFNKLKKKGFNAYSVGKKGQRVGDPLDEFDPDEEKIIMVPAMQGGQ